MTPLKWPVRVWIVAEIMFGAVGASAVLVSPERTAENFAWPIASPVGAAVIGACYGSVALMLLVALFARYWEQVRAVVVAAAALTSMMLAATMLHWSQFSVGTPAFAIWLISYLVPPPTLVVLYRWQQRRATAHGQDMSQPLPRWWRRWLAVNGAVLVSVWSLLFIAPQLVTRHTPWPTSPVLIRVYAGWLVGYGLLLLVTAADNDRRRTTAGVTWLGALPALLAVQLGRFAEQVNWRSPGLLLLLADIAVLGVVGATMWAARRVRPRHLAMFAAVAIGAFLFVLAVLPALRPELDVRARWVGEYVPGRFGVLMTIAYVALGLGAIALSASLREAVGGARSATAGRALLVLAGCGAFSAALLPQNPTDGAPGTPAGALRDLLLVPTFLSLAAALVLIATALWRQPQWHRVGVLVAVGTVVIVAALAVSVLSPDSWRGLAGRYFDGTWSVLLLALALSVVRAETPSMQASAPSSS